MIINNGKRKMTDELNRCFGLVFTIVHTSSILKIAAFRKLKTMVMSNLSELRIERFLDLHGSHTKL